jgi:predicted dehydrogenase
MTPVRWGLLGAGFIATRGVGPAMHAADGAVVQAVAARDVVRAQALEPVRASASYDDVVTADDVDAVYISLPNDAHLRWAVAAMEAGKDVLCEKPLALDAAQVRAMADTARRTGRLLVEASWNRWHPRTRRYAVLAAALTGLRDVRAWFTFPGVPDGNYRLDQARGGGALLDVGCYAVSAAVLALGPGLRVVDAEQHRSPAGVDLTTSAVLESEAGSARVTASFEQQESQGVTVVADGLTLSLGPPAFTSWHDTSQLRVREEGQDRVEVFAACDPYRLMVEAFSLRARGEGDPDGDAWVVPLADSLAVATVLDSVAHAAVPA